jgi:uncharacterized protein YhaN
MKQFTVANALAVCLITIVVRRLETTRSIYCTIRQLYLALRLASLEKYMESAEPMPFIVDDILVHFDDERSRATLGVLAELAEKTQIILFTHHRRLVEQAQALGAASPVTVHEL